MENEVHFQIAPQDDDDEHEEERQSATESMEVPSRIIYNAADLYQQQSLDEFLAAYAPTRVSQSQASWICIHGTTDSTKGEGDEEGLEREWLALCSKSTRVQPTADHIKTLAQRFGVLSGKWMLFIQRSKIDATWSRIATATASGELGCAAKVSPSGPGASGEDPTHLICVYVDDFTDQVDVWRVRESLRGMGFTQRLAFKADAYTYVGIYSGNEWGISPSIYNA